MEDNYAIQNILVKLTSETDLLRQKKIKEELAVYVNHLLLHDFSGLIQILYRVDVSEKKLKQLLKDHPQTDAAIIISELLIERQLQKIKTRSAYRRDNDIDDTDRW